MSFVDPAAPEPRPLRRDRRGGPRPGVGRRTNLSRLSPACHAYLDAWLGPVADRPDWLRDASMRDLVTGAYLRCLIHGHFLMAIGFRDATTKADRNFLRTHLETLVPPNFPLPPLSYVRELL